MQLCHLTATKSVHFSLGQKQIFAKNAHFFQWPFSIWHNLKNPGGKNDYGGDCEFERKWHHKNILQKNNLPSFHPQEATRSGPCTFNRVKIMIKNSIGCLAGSRRREKNFKWTFAAWILKEQRQESAFDEDVQCYATLQKLIAIFIMIMSPFQVTDYIVFTTKAIKSLWLRKLMFVSFMGANMCVLPCVCLCACVCFLSACLPSCLSVCAFMSASLPVCLYICLSVYVCLPVCVCASAYLFVCVCMLVYMQ